LHRLVDDSPFFHEMLISATPRPESAKQYLLLLLAVILSSHGDRINSGEELFIGT